MDCRPLPLHWLLLVSSVLLFGIFSGCDDGPRPPIAPTEQPRVTPTEQPRVTPTEQPRVVGVDVIDTGTTTVVVGGNVQFYAVVRYSDGARVPKPTATWRSSDETVATVVFGGLATGRRAGRADIQATYEGQTGSIRLDVTAP